MIIEVVGKEIEKIKGDFESYLNGLNMVGEISYSQYSELYDEGTKQIQRAYELGKSELKKENADLEKENAELKRDKDDLIFIRNQNAKCMCEDKERFIKAKELLKQWLQTSNASSCDNINIVTDTKQFISEVEK